MVAKAEKKECSDQLAVGDEVEFLKKISEPVGLLVAADSAETGTLFCYSTEPGEEECWQLRVTGHYGYHRR